MGQAGGPLNRPLHAIHPIPCQGVYSRGREEESDNGGVVIVSSLMQKGLAPL